MEQSNNWVVEAELAVKRQRYGRFIYSNSINLTTDTTADLLQQMPPAQQHIDNSTLLLSLTLLMGKYYLMLPPITSTPYNMGLATS